MKRADPLSRRPDHEEGVKLDNRDQILLKPEYFIIKALQPTHNSLVDDSDIIKRIKKALEKDEVTVSYRQLMTKGAREFSKGLEDWNFEEGLLIY